jgi:hypothetical protein
MRGFARLAFVAAIAATPIVCQADPTNLAHMTLGYTYYNLPGATQADHDTVVAECAKEALKVRSIDSQVNFSGGLLVDALSSAYNRGVFGAALENCMVVRGWRVVSLPEAEGKTLAKLSAGDLAVQLAPWIGADDPHGNVVRVWGNDAANAAVTRFAIRPDHTNDGLLSLKAATASDLAKIELPAQPQPPKIKFDAKWPTKPLKPEQFSGLMPEAAIIVVDVKGLSGKNGIGISLTRMGPDKETSASPIDHAPDQLNALVGLLAAKKEGNFVALEVPPGQWRISSMGVMPVLSFCLGAPSFSVAPGEIVYAGAFDLSAADLGPDLSLDAPKAWLAGQPAADAIRPAVYTNGSQGPCGYNDIYALEIKGAPFEPDYHWGSMAHPPAEPPAQ